MFVQEAGIFIIGEMWHSLQFHIVLAAGSVIMAIRLSKYAIQDKRLYAGYVDLAIAEEGLQSD